MSEEREQASSVSETGEDLSPKEAKQVEPGIKGMLALLAIMVVLSPFVIGVQTVFYYHEVESAPPPPPPPPVPGRRSPIPKTRATTHCWQRFSCSSSPLMSRSSWPAST